MHELGYHGWCGRSSAQPSVAITNIADCYHDACGGSHWLRLMFLNFFLLNRPLYWASTMHIMIKHHCTDQQPYDVMVTYHMHYDNPPLYCTHTHLMGVLGFKIYSQWTLPNQLTQQGSVIMMLSFLPHKLSVDSKKKWLKRDLWSDWIESWD